MKPTLEPPRPDAAPGDGGPLRAFERREAVFSWNWHYHPELELTLIGKGHGLRLVGDHTGAYRPGELVLLGGGLPHTWVSDEASRRNEALVVQFRPEVLPGPVRELCEFAGVRSLLDAAGRGLLFGPRVGRRLGPELRSLVQARGLARWLGLVRLLGELSGEAGEPLSSSAATQHPAQLPGSRLDRVLAYIEAHFFEPLPVGEVAAVARLTPDAFTRFFRRYTHRSFVRYRNARRVQEACRLLVESDFAVTQIAFECGFNNLANFNRRFSQEKGMTPRDYRQLHEPGR